jgi:hypothetical protein
MRIRDFLCTLHLIVGNLPQFYAKCVKFSRLFSNSSLSRFRLDPLNHRWVTRAIGEVAIKRSITLGNRLNQQIAANKAASPASSTPTKDLSLIATRPWLVYAELEGLRFFLHSLREGKVVGCN